MNYDIVIVKISRPQIKKVLAHHLAADPSVSLQKALSLLDNLPVAYMKNLSVKELEATRAKLDKMGVHCRVVESRNPLDGKDDDAVSRQDTSPANEAKREEPKAAGRKTKEGSVHPGQRVAFTGITANHPESRQQKTAKKMPRLVNLLLLLVIVAVVSMVIIVGKNKTIKIRSTGPLLSKTGKGNKKSETIRRRPSRDVTDAADEKDERKGAGEDRRKMPISPTQKKSSESYADSAVMTGNDYTRAIKFYKIAISFNRYNLRAWQGLLVTYRNARMWKEAEEIKNRMAELFQEETFSIGEIIEPYGMLSGFNRDPHGVCRIEYRSNAVKRAFLEKETFDIIRALTAHAACQSIALYAATGRGKGMLVRIPVHSFPTSFSGYRKVAQISFVE